MGTDVQVTEDMKVDVPDEFVAVQGVKTTAGGGAAAEEPQSALPAVEALENSFSLRAMVRDASARLKTTVSLELRRLASSISLASNRSEPASSAALHALVGLKFVRQTDGAAGWQEVEKRFLQLTASTHGLLHRSRFAECIGWIPSLCIYKHTLIIMLQLNQKVLAGMDKESSEFGGKLFDALARRREIKVESIDKDQLADFWDLISDDRFYSRLQIFFDM